MLEFKLIALTVQAGLCRTWSETTLLVFPRGGSFGCIKGLHGGLDLVVCFGTLTPPFSLKLSPVSKKCHSFGDTDSVISYQDKKNHTISVLPGCALFA